MAVLAQEHAEVAVHALADIAGHGESETVCISAVAWQVHITLMDGRRPREESALIEEISKAT